MDSSGIRPVSEDITSQINKLASKKGSESKVLVAKVKGKKVKFSAVKAPKVSTKSKKSKPVKGADEAVRILGITDRKVVSVSPTDAKKYIADCKMSEMTKALGLELSLSSGLSSSTSSLSSDLGSSISGSNSSLNTLHSDFSASSTSLDSAIESSISGSTSSLDSLDAEGQPIFGTYQPKSGTPKMSLPPLGGDSDVPDYPAPPPPLKGKLAPPPLPPKKGNLPPPRPQKHSLNATVPPPVQQKGSHKIESDHVNFGLMVSGGKPEITFELPGDLDLDLPPDYPPPPIPLPPKLPPRPTKHMMPGQKSLFSQPRYNYRPETPPASQAELKRLETKYNVQITTLKIDGSPVGYVFSNKRTQGAPKPTTLLVEAHGSGHNSAGQKLPTFTTPSGTRFLMSARRNQTFEVSPWKQAEAVSKGKIDFGHDDQIYGSMDHGSGITMTNYRLYPITKKQGDTYDLNFEKTAKLMHDLKASAKINGQVNEFDMVMLDPNMPGHLTVEDFTEAASQQGFDYRNTIMNVCRPQQAGKVNMTMAKDNMHKKMQNRVSQMGLNQQTSRRP